MNVILRGRFMTGGIPIRFDGRAFQPLVPVDIPDGTVCMAHVVSAKLPGPMTDEQRATWAEIMAIFAATDPHFPTVDEAIAVSRGRP